MKLKFKEDPKEWRKSVLLTSLGLAIVSSLLWWRNHLGVNGWLALLALLGLVALCAVLQPHWFRSWYRLSLRLGFYSSQIIGRCALLLLFMIVITPLGWVLRLAGKDALQLRRPRETESYWVSSKDSTSMDRLF